MLSYFNCNSLAAGAADMAVEWPENNKGLSAVHPGLFGRSNGQTVQKLWPIEVGPLNPH